VSLLAHTAALLVAVAVFTTTGGATTGRQAAANTVTANTSPPTIVGETGEGQTLTASPGSWSRPTPIACAYQWFRCGENLDDRARRRDEQHLHGRRRGRREAAARASRSPERRGSPTS